LFSKKEIYTEFFTPLFKYHQKIRINKNTKNYAVLFPSYGNSKISIQGNSSTCIQGFFLVACKEILKLVFNEFYFRPMDDINNKFFVSFKKQEKYVFYISIYFEKRD